MTTTEKQESLANFLRKVVDFVDANRRGTGLQGINRDTLCRFIIHSHMTGKLALYCHEGQVKCVVFYHADVFEHLEHRFSQGKSIYEWEPSKNGDCLFVGDVIGEMKYVAMLYQASLEKFPHLSITPLWTLRKGKLHRLTKQTLERILNKHGQ